MNLTEKNRSLLGMNRLIRPILQKNNDTFFK